MAKTTIHQSARRLKVGDARAGQRIDNFLAAHLKGVPRNHIYRLLRRGEVRVNSARTRPHYRLKAGDEVRLPPLRLSSPASPFEPPLWLERHILYEDKALLVLNKPSGMAVHGGSGLGFGVIEALRALRPGHELELVHRLDRETSGCLLIAKKRSLLRALHQRLRLGQVEKRYLALVKGTMEGKKVDAALQKYALRSGERIVKVAPEGKAARTHFKPLSNYPGATLVEVSLLTGRTHQIRVHAAHLGHPLAGDSKYGEAAFNRTMGGKGLRRLFLHAVALAFVHPETNEEATFHAPLPEDLKALLDRLEG